MQSLAGLLKNSKDAPYATLRAIFLSYWGMILHGLIKSAALPSLEHLCAGLLNACAVAVVTLLGLTLHDPSGSLQSQTTVSCLLGRSIG